MNPRLSIVIPAYNVQEFVAEAVQSALAQTEADIEVIVIDDGSTDQTAEILASFDDPRLVVIKQANAGLSSARNAGIRAARAQFIGFLDADDRWHPTKAEKQLQVMRSSSQIGLTFSYSAYIDEEGAHIGRLPLAAIADPTLEQVIVRNCVGNGSAPIVRAECFIQAGYFDETLRSCEDWEMWVRILRDTSYRFRLVPEILTEYRVNTRSLSMNFTTFLESADRAAAKIARETPSVSRSIISLGLAMSYRIAGTKALLYGKDRATSIRLIGNAILISPRLLLMDPRLVGTVFAILAPSKAISAMRWISKGQAKLAR